jgi:hypothetical protein
VGESSWGFKSPSSHSRTDSDSTTCGLCSLGGCVRGNKQARIEVGEQPQLPALISRLPLAVVLTERLVGHSGLLFEPRDLHPGGKGCRYERVLRAVEPTLTNAQAA